MLMRTEIVSARLSGDVLVMIVLRADKRATLVVPAHIHFLRGLKADFVR